MKILSIDKVREGDAYTIKNEPIESINLMERAATACAGWIEKHIINDRRIVIFCGLGNNGGDGLAIGRLLHDKNYRIEIYIIRHSDKYSEDFKINYERLKEIPEIKVTDIKEGEKLPEIYEGDIVIDAIFGSGLTKACEGICCRSDRAYK